jgi:hypothetical protein
MVLSQSPIFGQNPKMGCQEFNDLETPKLSKKQLCDRAGPERLAQRACSLPAPPRGACPAPARSDLADNPQHPDPAPTVTREDLQAMRVLLEVLVDQLPPQLTSRRCSDPRESEGRTGALRGAPSTAMAQRHDHREWQWTVLRNDTALSV